jgi:hypothetical protein
MSCAVLILTALGCGGPQPPIDGQVVKEPILNPHSPAEAMPAESP